jgi:hypothetical protein
VCSCSACRASLCAATAAAAAASAAMARRASSSEAAAVAAAADTECAAAVGCMTVTDSYREWQFQRLRLQECVRQCKFSAIASHSL